MDKAISSRMVGTPRSRMIGVVGGRLAFVVLNLLAMCLVWALDRKFFNAAMNTLDKDIGMTGNDAFGIAVEGCRFWLVAQLPIILIAAAYSYWCLVWLGRKSSEVKKIGRFPSIIIAVLWILTLIFHSQTPIALPILFAWVHMPRF